MLSLSVTVMPVSTFGQEAGGTTLFTKDCVTLTYNVIPKTGSLALHWPFSKIHTALRYYHRLLDLHFYSYRYLKPNHHGVKEIIYQKNYPFFQRKKLFSGCYQPGKRMMNHESFSFLWCQIKQDKSHCNGRNVTLRFYRIKCFAITTIEHSLGTRLQEKCFYTDSSP